MRLLPECKTHELTPYKADDVRIPSVKKYLITAYRGFSYANAPAGDLIRPSKSITRSDWRRQSSQIRNQIASARSVYELTARRSSFDYRRFSQMRCRTRALMLIDCQIMRWCIRSIGTRRPEYHISSASDPRERWARFCTKPLCRCPPLARGVDKG